MDDKIIEKTTVTEMPVTQIPSATVKTTTVSRRSFSLSNFFVSKTNQVIFAFISIIDLLILLRFVFILFGANQVGILSFLIGLTDFFVGPFKGIFPSQAAYGAGYIEVPSILAIIVITIFGFILGTIIELFTNETE